MADALYETFHKSSPLGVSYAWRTNSGGHHPLHWHDELEILYPLSGKADIVIDGIRHNLAERQLMVVESGQIHSTHSEKSSYMFLCIHVCRGKLIDYMPEIKSLRIRCLPGNIKDSEFPRYLKICQMLDELTKLYIQESPAFHLEAEGLILQVMAQLIDAFSIPVSPLAAHTDKLTTDRIHDVMHYVEEHFHEPLSLSAAAAHLGLSKEYFCRFFKKNMGISFLQYLNEIRCAHIYYDLLHTDLTILEIIEKNGFTNQKLFNRTFKTIYGSTPSEVRRGTARSQDASHAAPI